YVHFNQNTKPHKEEMEMKVRPGDNITLYCDRSLTLGSVVVWIRNCSHENQPSLIIDFRKLGKEIFQRFSFIHNPYSKSYDLHITNISVSDLGLYYWIISSSEVYYYGNQTTRLSLKGKKTSLTCTDEEVCYASLDVITKRQKQRKTKRVQSSDFSTYAQVRTQTE
uniref:Immunoglobulin V-set domain-containing protein n=1 Tax=Sinocyclocheilus grahami TaxID=75366 RepID=A0A672KI01_SINGR